MSCEMSSEIREKEISVKSGETAATSASRGTGHQTVPQHRTPGAKGSPQAEPFSLANRLALRPREAAQALGLSERKLREVLPQLPHVRVGGAVLLPVEALRTWLEQQAKVEPGRVDAVVKEILASVTPAGGD